MEAFRIGECWSGSSGGVDDGVWGVAGVAACRDGATHRRALLRTVDGRSRCRGDQDRGAGRRRSDARVGAEQAGLVARRRAQQEEHHAQPSRSARARYRPAPCGEVGLPAREFSYRDDGEVESRLRAAFGH